MSETPLYLSTPTATGRELGYIADAIERGELAGDGRYTKLCHSWLESRTNSPRALLTHSCTAALEMAALLLDLQPGDEVIMPSFTFVSTANAFVLRGAVPVFVDIRTDTLNIDETLIEAAITPRTRAIVPVHYAGVACEMDVIMAIAVRHGLHVVEDAAQGIGASYHGRALGSIGDFGALSFHESKNLVSGEGGALLVNRREHAIRAEIIREKGTDRSRFFRGEVDKYTWQEMGSSFLPSELTAACLWAQLEGGDMLTAARINRWGRYHDMLAPLENNQKLRRPVVPEHCSHNGHIYAVILPTADDRQRATQHLNRAGIGAAFHYVPLHSSPAGLRYGRVSCSLAVTDDLSARLLRLPMSSTLDESDQTRVVQTLAASLD